MVGGIPVGVGLTFLVGLPAQLVIVFMLSETVVVPFVFTYPVFTG